MDLFKSVAHYLKNTDLYLAVIAFICSGYGMALIYSATLNPVSIKDDGSTKNLYVQGAAILIGFGAVRADEPYRSGGASGTGGKTSSS